MVEPTAAQIVLVLLAALLVASGVGLSIPKAPALRLWTAIFTCAGIAVATVALVWHAVQRRSWFPLDDNFDSLLWLAILTALMSLYLQGRKAIGRIEWFLLPIVVLLLCAAAFFGVAVPHEYTRSLWNNLHLIAVFTGPIALALAAASGIMYLVLRARLRNKSAPVDARFGSLERLEHLTYNAVTIGFALLTVGLITGVVRAVQADTKLGTHWFWQPKVLLAMAAYVLYALVLHSPINPSFRGRRTAILSIAGFVLLLGTIGVVQVMR
jgi:ABC-type transport system involved in cytochrome c biogenesis permease subunit